MCVLPGLKLCNVFEITLVGKTFQIKQLNRILNENFCKGWFLVFSLWSVILIEIFNISDHECLKLITNF